ncbi:MAG: mechanosensitive ion channel [Gemmatimonadales bacterium]|nr:mechanosensitive ion channel [Gemmatimonadales bacterium]NIN12789.1 mechanosensitive ion channel [Gemmatimonadales bacterium]NIN51014.1 mechanosensitive ion channel [Gemmatimonadales bacterium]NIP08478.1 mechanosensitive ion channel [Gemmatimonadales bacterium]NIR00914.1 mechanosensitive ion channel [Gemmatimonadales bacterium]
MTRILLALQVADTAAAGDRQSIVGWLAEPTLAAQATGLLLVALAAYVADKLARKLLLTTVGRLVRGTTFRWDDVLHEFRVFQRLAHLAPAAAVYYGVKFLPSLPEAVSDFVANVAAATMVMIGVLAAGSVLSAVNEIYATTPSFRGRPIKGYVQIAKILLYILGAVLAVATLIGESPLLFLSGIGAMTAVLLLIFRDTILSFVASLQMASYDLVRVGDWIEVPQYGADGDVVDIALHTIKVQNWDKTITTIPTHRLIDGSFKNWRGMSESGGRRIKRALYIDMNTIRFLEEADIERFESFALLRDYIRRKKTELAADAEGRRADPELVANARRLTNIGTFRAYVVNYLRQHPKVHRGMTLMVRQRDPTPDGLPLEIYAFSNDTEWVTYEGIQSDIFDHMLAVAAEFGLRVFQHPSGRDFEAALRGRVDANAAPV